MPSPPTEKAPIASERLNAAAAGHFVNGAAQGALGIYSCCVRSTHSENRMGIRRQAAA